MNLQTFFNPESRTKIIFFHVWLLAPCIVSKTIKSEDEDGIS